jgi:hypothetical protein
MIPIEALPKAGAVPLAVTSLIQISTPIISPRRRCCKVSWYVLAAASFAVNVIIKASHSSFAQKKQLPGLSFFMTFVTITKSFNLLFINLYYFY